MALQLGCGTHTCLPQAKYFTKNTLTPHFGVQKAVYIYKALYLHFCIFPLIVKLGSANVKAIAQSYKGILL